MRNTYIIADNITAPLGSTTRENLDELKKGHSGIRLQHRPMAAAPFYASLFDEAVSWSARPALSRFENLALHSLQDALSKTSIDLKNKKTLFILSSTKGNIGLLESSGGTAFGDPVFALAASAARISEAAGFVTEPVVVSHACISGLLGLITGMRLIRSGVYDQVAVTGADLITEFVLSGFQSFQAISTQPCRPFDASRDGISLGEGAGTVILSARPDDRGNIRVSGGSVSNDANHISGPSRTGAELQQAIAQAMRQAGAGAGDIDFISAHGTATRYNDDMEANAVTLAGMQLLPVNSLKGYYGHTLGAAGVIETIVSMHSMEEGIIFATRGFREAGTTKPIHVVSEHLTGNFNSCLKTASGFGGCNAAIVLEKNRPAGKG